MGIAYLCKPDSKLALAVWDGLVTWDVWRAHLEGMLDDPAYAPMQSHIASLRHASISPGISTDQIQAVIELIAARRQQLSLRKLAIAAGEEWMKPKEVEAALRPVGIQAIVFNDLSTACLWLGADASEIQEHIEQLRLKLRSAEQP